MDVVFIVLVKVSVIVDGRMVDDRGDIVVVDALPDNAAVKLNEVTFCLVCEAVG